MDTSQNDSFSDLDEVLTTTNKDLVDLEGLDESKEEEWLIHLFFHLLCKIST